MSSKKKGYTFLLILTVVFILAAVSTVVPQSSVSKECILGYKAHCTFAPISTILCIIVAGLICVVRKKKLTESQ